MKMKMNRYKPLFAEGYNKKDLLFKLNKSKNELYKTDEGDLAEYIYTVLEDSDMVSYSEDDILAIVLDWDGSLSESQAIKMMKEIGIK